MKLRGAAKVLDGIVSMTFSRVSNGADYWSLRIEDANSGVMIVEAHISPENFSAMMSGLGHNPCEIELYPSYEIAGKFFETKTIHVPQLNDLDRRRWKANAPTIIAFAMVEQGYVDGWTPFGVEAESPNMHRKTKHGYAVSIHRVVDEDPRGTE